MKKSLRLLILSILILSLCAAVTACNKKQETTDETNIDTSYDPADYVELCDYRNVPVSDDEVTVSDADVEEYIQSEMDQYATTEEISDRGAEFGDVVSINIQGYIDGKTVDTLKTYWFEIDLGDGALGLDFEAELVGMKKGETKTFDIPYSKDYPSDNLAGKTVTYEVKMNYILDVTEYELTDENIEYLSDGAYTTVDEAKAAASQYLLETDFDTYWGRYLLRKMVDSCTIKGYPENLLTVYEADMVANYTNEALYAGHEDFEQYLTDFYGMTMDDFAAYIEEYCKSAIREEMIYTLIAQKENIVLTDEEYEEYVTMYAEAYEEAYYYSMTPEEFTESLGEENIRQALTIKKTQEKIIQWNSAAGSENT